MVPMSSVKGQRQEPYTVINLWHRSPGVSPQERLAVPHCPTDRPLTALCPPQTHLLAATLSSPSSPLMPSARPWVWAESLLGAGKIALVQGLWPGGLGRDQDKVEEIVIRTVCYQRISYPFPATGMEMRAESYLEGSQPLSAWIEPIQACPSAAWPLPSLSPAVPEQPFSGK